ncbi:MAG: WXG100 family type VII secretion target, partial [Lachnospiraceae bacterium]
KVTPEEVRRKAQEIAAQRNLMETYMQDMMGKVTQLGDSWKAQSGESYIEKYQNITKNIQKSLSVLEQHINNLTQAAQRYEELENTQTQAIGALGTDNIFG